MKAYLVSLGCPKNTVDSEASLGILRHAGWTIAENPEEADLLIVNACSFLDTAWRETVEEVDALSKLKTSDPSKKLILMGCLPLHRRDAWRESLRSVDHFLSSGNHSLLPSVAAALRDGRRVVADAPAGEIDRFAGFENRVRTTPRHIAYVKIAEGCSRTCSFCAIPAIRGTMVSRSAASIVREVRSLVEDGVKEVSLLAQDITSYSDGGKRFPDLVDELSQTGIEWMRVFYVHPASLTQDFAKRIFRHPSVCRYLEVPVQHASDRLLERMGRNHTRDHVERVIGGIRADFPDVVVRSEVIVGFPGETDDDFDELKRFVESMEFASLGVFVYSAETGTAGASMEGRVPGTVASERAGEISDLQRSVTFGLLSGEKGRRHRILVDRSVDEDAADDRGPSYAGRYYGQAYEIDGEVFLRGRDLHVGEFIEATITDADAFDLEAEMTGRQMS